MVQSITRNGNRALEETLQLQMAQLQAEGILAHHALLELDCMHEDTSALYATAMAIAHQAIQQAEQSGRLTPFQQAALYYRTRAYMYELLATVEATGESIVC